jgi:hypothetical protein
MLLVDVIIHKKEISPAVGGVERKPIFIKRLFFFS